jgi:ribosomal protein S21
MNLPLSGISVVVSNGNIEKAIRILKGRCEKAGIRADNRRHEFFLSRAERRKVKDHKSLIRVNKRREYDEQYGPKWFQHC